MPTKPVVQCSMAACAAGSGAQLVTDARVQIEPIVVSVADGFVALLVTALRDFEPKQQRRSGHSHSSRSNTGASISSKKSTPEDRCTATTADVHHHLSRLPLTQPRRVRRRVRSLQLLLLIRRSRRISCNSTVHARRHACSSVRAPCLSVDRARFHPCSKNKKVQVYAMQRTLVVLLVDTRHRTN